MRYINTELVVRLCLSLLLLSVPGLAAAETIDLVPQDGTFMVPVRINDAVTIPFVLDSGAGVVSVPEDVLKTLLRTGTVTKSDFREPGVYVMADGSKRSAQRFILHELRVGDHVVRNVVASVAPDKADPLLGQSFLGTLPRWAIDDTRHALVIDASGEGERLQAAIAAPPQPAVRAATKPPTLIEGVVAYANRDYATAVSIYRLLADQGDAEAQSWLGLLYYDGEGVAQDYVEAVRWYRMAADQGHADAQHTLGLLYANGQGVAQDYAEAARWYKKAADQGYALAQNDLGLLYANGQGVAQSYAEAARWYRKAADQGYANAQFHLGFLYANGHGVAQDNAEAARWYRKAAEQGNADAQNNLGVLYMYGEADPMRHHRHRSAPKGSRRRAASTALAMPTSQWSSLSPRRACITTSGRRRNSAARSSVAIASVSRRR